MHPNAPRALATGGLAFGLCLLLAGVILAGNCFWRLAFWKEGFADWQKTNSYVNVRSRNTLDKDQYTITLPDGSTRAFEVTGGWERPAPKRLYVRYPASDPSQAEPARYTWDWLLGGAPFLFFGLCLGLPSGLFLYFYVPSTIVHISGMAAPNSIADRVGRMRRGRAKPSPPRDPDLPLVILDEKRVFRTPPDLPDEEDEDEDRLRRRFPARLPREAAELGRPRFRLERGTRPTSIFEGGMVGGLFMLGGFSLVGVVVAYFNLSFLLSNDRSGRSVSSAVLFFLGGVGWVLLCVGLAALALREAYKSIKAIDVVFTGGFAEFDGRRWRIWRWEDIASFNLQRMDIRSYVYFIQVDRTLATSYSLRHRDGTRFLFYNTWGSRCAQFGSLAEKETFTRVMREARSRLAQGETMDFAPFRIEPAGLAYGEHFTPWAEVGPLDIQAGSLIVGGAGSRQRPVQVMLGSIDNCHVFLPLLAEILEQMAA